MNRRVARHLFAVASRLLLAVALLFATGPWAGLLAAAQAADCTQMMGAMPHGANSGDDCCADMRSDHGMTDCGKHGTVCSGGCAALCSVSSAGALPAVMAFARLPLATATPLPRTGLLAPSQFISPALRPPISL